MAQITVEQQIEAIRKVTEDALKSPEAALQFLIRAGIVKERTEPIQKKIRQTKKK